VLPAKAAAAFQEFWLANPQSMPLIDVGAPSDPTLRRVAPGSTCGTDPLRYRVYRQVI
jgi:uncharacterized protein YcsI (UPF0317 family)